MRAPHPPPDKGTDAPAERPSALRQPRSGVVRLACSEPCEVQAQSTVWHGTIWNVSVLGAYVALDGILPDVGTEVHLSFKLPADSIPIATLARVAWQNPASLFKGCGEICAPQPPGCGLEFLALRDEDRERIRARVASTHMASR